MRTVASDTLSTAMSRSRPTERGPRQDVEFEHVSHQVGPFSLELELVGELVQYENSCRLCYVRGPEAILVASPRTSLTIRELSSLRSPRNS